MVRLANEFGRGTGDYADGFLQSCVEMRQAHAVRENLGQVVVAERVKRVADIVAGAGHGDPGIHEIVHQRYPAPKRSAGKLCGGAPAVLQVQVAVRQRDDADARCPDQRDRGLGAGVILTASTKIIDVSGSEPVEHVGYVPPRKVVIPGTRPRQFPAGTFDVPCALIIGERTESTDRKTSLNSALRELGVDV